MSVTLKTMMNRLAPERRRRIKKRAKQLITEELKLRDLRKARGMTQDRIAEKLQVGQDSVSRLEQRSDLLISTLRDYVGALGGTLELVARFPDHSTVTLLDLMARGPAIKRSRRRVTPAISRGGRGKAR